MQAIEQYCDISGIHGVQFFTRRWPLFERVLWFALVATSIALSGLSLQQLFDNWKENPVIITIETTSMPIQLLAFPAISVCSVALDKTGFLQRYSLIHNF